ncbi:RNA polymerase sigma factor [Carboxylicivirga caseinilyticus]|uniref:RNA polymerase sigma factor n=1 Tax=Carboxylicivirga caseinilyticus TaxID=3417572 RepID=UPI003D332FB1|nr:sigma-70 family RNA polymerase sigma factor [Marinilabiliaceae bacterium A049]
MGKLRYNNNELLEGVYNRDSRIIKYIMGLVWVPVRDLVLQNSGKEDDAMNLIQEGFIAIYTKTEKPQLTASFTTYFYAICRNIWLNELRIRKKESSVLKNIENAVVITEEVDEEQLYEKRRQLYLKHFKNISKVCQDLLKLVSKGFSNEDITAELAFSSLQYMKNRRTQCNKKLLDMIKEDPQYKALKYGL